MSAHEYITKGISKAQADVFEQARVKSGLSRSAAIDEALKLFTELQGFDWPATAKHGGDRKSTKRGAKDANL